MAKDRREMSETERSFWISGIMSVTEGVTQPAAEAAMDLWAEGTYQEADLNPLVRKVLDRVELEWSARFP